MSLKNLGLGVHTDDAACANRFNTGSREASACSHTALLAVSSDLVTIRAACTLLSEDSQDVSKAAFCTRFFKKPAPRYAVDAPRTCFLTPSCLCTSTMAYCAWKSRLLDCGNGVGAGAGGSDGAAAAADAGAGVGDGAAAGTARFVEDTLAEKKRPAPTHREERAKNYRKKRNTAKNTANKKRDAGAGARGTAQPKTAKKQVFMHVHVYARMHRHPRAYTCIHTCH